MSNVTVCCRFRPLSSREKKENGDSVCIRSVDSETFVFKDEKDEESTFSFDGVFYEDSMQAQVYEFLCLPIVRDAFNGINGTIVTYGQTGAGKTYSMEGPGILECDEDKKGLLPRLVDGLFGFIESANESVKYTVKLSMVEIYMEKVRDLLDLTNDNILIKENKAQEIVLSGVTKVNLSNSSEALQSLSSGIVNRAVGETQMNMASSRSHCIYIFNIHQELTAERRVKAGKVILVDLAGSEKVEKTGAEGKILEEAKTINKSLSALGNVINALTSGQSAKANHIPYRDSKLTRILQDALGGNSRMALLCCCSPSRSNASETLSTLRFGSRAKHVKSLPLVSRFEEKQAVKQVVAADCKDESRERILNKLKGRLNVEDVNLLEELLVLEGIFFDPSIEAEIEADFQDVTVRTISLLQQAVEELRSTVQELRNENKALKLRIATTDTERLEALRNRTGVASILQNILDIVSRVWQFRPFKRLE